MNNYITYGYRLVDGYMRMNPEQSEAVHLIFDATEGISLPDEIKDEVFLVVGERRIHP